MANSNPCSQRPSERSKSCDTACSSNSSCFFQKRKPPNPLANPLRSSLSRSTGNSVRQRVLSAKLLKLKSLQNQLNDANFHLAEVIRENQALKTLQKRQDKALTKYEGANAELPRLIQRHEEEIRVLTEKNKALRKSVKELNEQLKHKSDEVSSLQEQLKHYEKLDKDRHLLEREKLLDELQDVRAKLEKADSEIVTLNRKLSLESKTSKQRLNTEMVKHRQSQKDLAQSLVEINKLNKLLESKDSKLPRRRFSSLAAKTSSLTSLNGTKSEPEFDKAPVTEVKLQVLAPADDCKPKSILKAPSELIKARLTSDQTNGEARSRPSSMKKLEKIEMNLQNTIKKMENGDEVGKHLGNYCLQAIDTVKTYNEKIEQHKERLAFAKDGTDQILESVKSANQMEERLKVSLNDDNLDFVSKILKEEVEFQTKYADRDNGVGKNDKKKLLATLRAIDNGESVDSFESDSHNKNHLIKELFGDVAN